QEYEPRPAVHLPLDRLQPVHVSLHGAVAPPPHHRRLHTRLVTTDAFGEPAQVRVRRGLTARQPLAQGRGRPLPDQLGEPVRRVPMPGTPHAAGSGTRTAGTGPVPGRSERLSDLACAAHGLARTGRCVSDASTARPAAAAIPEAVRSAVEGGTARRAMKPRWS